MDQQIDNIIHYLSRSHVEMAKILEEEKHTAVHVSQLINSIPNHPSFKSIDELCKNSLDITDSICTYLNNIAELEEAIAVNTTYVFKEMIGGQQEDE